MTWKEIKDSISESLLSRRLEKPNVRLNALDRIEVILKENFPEYLQSPQETFGKISKNDLKEKIAKHKDNGKLNGAEESVINEIYYRIL